MPALLNALLPPNVFYLEREFGGQTVRTKYAVLSLADFQKGTSRRWFHSYLWARFSQPTALLYACNDEVAAVVLKCLADTPMRFAMKAATAQAMTSGTVGKSNRARRVDAQARALVLSRRAEAQERLFA